MKSSINTRMNNIIASAVGVITLSLSASAAPSLLITIVPEPATNAVPYLVPSLYPQNPPAFSRAYASPNLPTPGTMPEIHVITDMSQINDNRPYTSYLYTEEGAWSSGAINWAKGDGAAYVQSHFTTQMDPGGLTLATAADRGIAINTINGFPVADYGGVVRPSSPGDYTTFYDTTLLFGGFNQATDETVTLINTTYVHVQEIYTGDFAIYSTPRRTEVSVGQFEYDKPVLLLAGTISKVTVFGVGDSTSGSIETAPLGITYTGGEILKYVPSTDRLGEMSLSLLDVMAKYPLTTPNTPEYIADMVGQFNLVPEPGALSLLALSAMGLMARRRSQK